MTFAVRDLAELAGCVAVVVGGWLLGNIGGAVLGLGAVLLYEAHG